MEVLPYNNIKMKPYVLVSGSSSGIGKAIAIELSKLYNVILNGRSDERLNEVKSYCSPENDSLIWKQDLNDVFSLESGLSAFLKEKGITVDYYVHCAGIMNMLPMKMQTIDSIQQTLNANVISAMLITKVLASKKLNKGNFKSIVYISSNISNRGAKAFNIYAASKGALDAYMRSMAMELAPKTRVNSILPGAILTEMTENIFENKEVEERMKATYPLGFGHPNDIVEGVRFLLSDRSKWITGQQLTIDGGRTVNITG